MAKKIEKKKANIEDVLQEKYGFGIIKTAVEFEQQDFRNIHFSPAHDLAMGGGVPEGSTLIMSGKPGTCKTSSILHFCVNAQQAGMDVYYADVEHRLKNRDTKIPGLDKSRFHVISSTPERHLLGYDFLDIIMDIMRDKTNAVFVLDSISMLAEGKSVEDGVQTSTRGGGAQIVSRFMSTTAGIVRPRKHILMATYHLMSNTSGYGKAYFEKGGNAGIYKADIKMIAKKSEYWMAGDDTLGQIVTWSLEKTALETTPNQEYDSYVRYGHGIDEVKEIVAVAESIGYIKKSGAWYSFEDDDVKFQGEDKMLNAIKENPEYLAKVNTKVAQFLS